MSSSVRLATASAILSLFMISAPLGAAGGGGGGGGGMPSDSAPAYDPVVEYQKGVAALQASRFGDAKRAFDRVLAVAPKDANTAYMAGLASDGLAKPKDARKYYEKALRSDKAHVEARQGLALALVKLGEPAKALAVQRKQQVRDSNDFLALLWSPQGRVMRELPEFQPFLHDFGLIDLWDQYGPPDLCEKNDKGDYVCE